MKWWPPSYFTGFSSGGIVREPPQNMDPRVAARELGRLGGRVVGHRRHIEAEARRHAEHERVKAMARRLRADGAMRPLQILEPTDFNEGA